LFAETCFALIAIALIWGYLRPRQPRRNEPEESNDDESRILISRNGGR
jgi:hypothetical protein